MKRNAVLTFATGYTLDQFAPFLASWAEHVRPAELVVFATGNDAAFVAATARLGVRVIAPPALRPYSIAVTRNFVFNAFLEAHGGEFDAVLLADSRDVVFQSDPFAIPRGREVTFATEDLAIGACLFNRWWVHDIYGAAVNAGMAEAPICCAGTTIGTAAGIRRYLDLICAESDARSTHLGEQVFHNYIAHVLNPDFVEIDRDDRIVQTIGYTDPARVRFVDGKVHVDGRAAAVVHQYDRHPTLVPAIRARYRMDAGEVAVRWKPDRGSRRQLP